MRDIVIKGEHIMHGIYITVIVILAVALIFKTSVGNGGEPHENGNDREEEEDTTQNLKDASVTIIKNTKPRTSPTVTAPKTPSMPSTPTTPEVENETQEDEPEEEEPEEELLPITGQVGLSIDKITTEIKGEDWGKVIKIKFTITNQKTKSFYPKILVYVWDDNDDADIKSYVEEEIYFEKAEARKAVTIEKDVSISFNEIDKEKTLKAVMYDEDDEELDLAIEEFTV